MYCKKCGKFIGTDADICPECQAKEAGAQQVGAQPVFAGQPIVNPNAGYNPGVKFGLGMAITGVILSTLSLIFFMIACESALLVLDYYYYADALGISIVMFMFALGFGIPGIVLGAKSIGNFKLAARSGWSKPIPALIMGIASLVQAITAVAFSGLLMLMMLAAV